METNTTTSTPAIAPVAAPAPKAKRAPRVEKAKADKPAKTKKTAKKAADATPKLRRPRKPTPAPGSKVRKALRVVDGEQIPLIKKVGTKKHDLSAYDVVISADGNHSLDCGDDLAKQLRGKTLDDVYKIAAKYTKEPETTLRAKYKHLNVGMQRMNLGNRIRGSLDA